MSNNQQHIDDLIARVLINEADEQQRAQLNNWISQSSANKVYFNELKKVFELTGKFREARDFDSEMALKRVKEKINQQKKIGVFQMYKWRAVAAVFILTASALAYYYWNSPKNETVQLVAVQKVLKTHLPDSTEITLNTNSSVSFNVSDFQNEKRLTLTGEAFLKVRNSAEKKLTIQCEDVLITDIGTSFNVKAYQDSSLLIVSVMEGAVKLYTLNDEGILVKPGFEGVYDKHSGKFYLQPLRDKNLTAYHDRIIIFDNTTVGEAINLLQKLYNISVSVDNEAIMQCRFSATFNNESIDTVMDILSETLNLKLIKNDKKYEILGEGCSNEI